MSRHESAVAAVVVNFQSLTYLMQLIPALLKDEAIAKIIIVDNSADDGARETVLAEFGGVTWISNGMNLGFAKAVNRGLKQVQGEHVLLINPDCLPGPGAITKMSRHLDAIPCCGIVAPLTRHPDRELKFLAAGEQPTTRRLFNHYMGVSELFPQQEWAKGWHLRNGHADRIRTVGWASGACLLIRAQAFREVGDLSEEWFMYAEDMEYCLRTTAAGWEIHHIPEAVVTHVIGGSSPKASTRWISVLLDYNDRYLSRSRAATLAARWVLFAGFLARAALSVAIAIHPDHRSNWHEIAVSNLRWGWRALQPERNGLDRAPADPVTPD